MRRLLITMLLLCVLLIGTVRAAYAQGRKYHGQALKARPSSARYYRSPAYRDYFKLSGRPHYHYAPSFHAYYNRRPYRPHYYRRRPSLALAHPQN